MDTQPRVAFMQMVVVCASIFHQRSASDNRIPPLQSFMKLIWQQWVQSFHYASTRLQTAINTVSTMFSLYLTFATMLPLDQAIKSWTLIISRSTSQFNVSVSPKSLSWTLTSLTSMTSTFKPQRSPTTESTCKWLLQTGQVSQCSWTLKASSTTCTAASQLKSSLLLMTLKAIERAL